VTIVYKYRGGVDRAVETLAIKGLWGISENATIIEFISG
jgi:hypothetical protein